MSSLLTYLLLSLLTLVVCLFAIWKGGLAERSGAGVILALVILQRLVQPVLPPEYRTLLSMGGDALTALGLLVLALRFASLWLGGTMMFYAAQFSLHAFYFVSDRPIDGLHDALNDANFMGIHICLITGTAIAWQRRRRPIAELR